jgi:nucleoside-diphosphate-sugar epimerase
VHSAAGTFHRVILRYFYPYAVGTPNKIPETVRRAVLGEPIEVLESRKPLINPLHISDAIEATVRCLDVCADHVLNIAGSEITSFADIAVRAASRVGRSPVLSIAPDAAASPWERADILGDIGRAQRQLAFTPRVSLDQGISELVEHCRGPRGA